MGIHVNIGEAKDRLSQLIAAAKRGEDVVIARAGKAEVRLTPVDGDPALDIAAQRRAFIGSIKRVEIAEELLAPMTEDELALWYDGPIFPDDDVPAA